MTATIIPFPCKPDGAERLFYTLARKAGFGHMTAEFDTVFPDICRRTRQPTMPAVIIPFPRKPDAPAIGSGDDNSDSAKLHQLLDQSMASGDDNPDRAKLHQLLDQAMASGKERSFYTLARKAGFGLMTTDFDDDFPEICRQTPQRPRHGILGR